MVRWADPRPVLSAMLAPLAVLGLVVLMQSVADSVLKHSQPDMPAHTVGKIPRCFDREGPQLGSSSTDARQCTTLLYAPAAVGWVDQLMEEVAKDAGLVFGRDVRPLDHAATDPSLADDAGPLPAGWCSNATMPCNCEAAAANCACLPCQLLQDQLELEQLFSREPNKTQSAVIFTTGYLYPDAMVRPDGGGSSGNWRQAVPPEAGYILYYNLSTSLEGQTLQPDFLLETKLAIDNALLRARTLLPWAKIEVEWRHFPQVPSRLSVYSVLASDGGVFFKLLGESPSR